MKHLACAHDDVAITAILEEFGPEGYGIYWLILEHMAIGIERDAEVVPTRVHSIVKWSQICYCSARKLRSFAQKATELGLIESQTTENRLQIDVPKLLKYRDEYSQRSGQSREFVGARTEQIQKQIQKREENPLPPLPSPDGSGGSAVNGHSEKFDEIQDWFNTEFWPVYPRHIGKEHALKAARSKLKTPDLRRDALNGIKSQLPDFQSRETDKIPHASTWINGRRWEDEPPTLFPAASVHRSRADRIAERR